MKITVEGNIFEGTPEEIKEMMTLMGAEFPESTKPKVEEEEAETNPKTEKRKARVGERILITNADSPGGQYKNGDILTVSKGFGKLGSPHAIQADGVDIGIYHNEYEVIIEESTPKFKEGDRVKALADGEYSYVNEGEIGTIVDIIEDDVDSYNIEVKTSDDYDYFRPQDLELIADETAKLEDGDYVVALPGAPYYITSSDMKLGKIVGNGKTADDDITVKVIAHDDAFRVGNEYSVESRYFRKATDEEIAKFTKKSRELKKGDIVRVIDSPSALPEGTIFEVESIDKYGYVYDDSPKNYVYMLPQEQLELIAPVESRVDVE